MALRRRDRKECIMETPENLRYTETHEWAKIEGDAATVGLTDYAQSELGDIVFVNLPEVGDQIVAGESFAEVETVPAVSDVNAPVSGTVVEINEALLDDPASINSDPYGAWFVRVEAPVEGEGLMDAEAYLAVCKG